MPTATIREAIDNASRYLTDHPTEARYTDSLATATLGADLRVRVTGPAGEMLETDMPPAVGGSGAAPSPGWFLRAAVAACVASLAIMRAAQLGLEGFGGSVEVDSESDDRGILGLDESVSAGPLRMSIRFRVTAAGADAATLREAAEWAVAHCPVSDAVRRAVPLSVEVVAD